MCLTPPLDGGPLDGPAASVHLHILHGIQEGALHKAGTLNGVVLCFLDESAGRLLLYIYIYLKFIYLFIFGCVGSSFLCEGFLQLAASGGRSSSRCAGLSLSRPLLLRSTGSRRAGSVVGAHRPSCSAACGIFPDQGSNPCPLHWQADSQPLRHQGSPPSTFSSSFAFYT